MHSFPNSSQLLPQMRTPHAYPPLPTHIVKTTNPRYQNVAVFGDRIFKKLIKGTDASESLSDLTSFLKNLFHFYGLTTTVELALTEKDHETTCLASTSVCKTRRGPS